MSNPEYYSCHNCSSHGVTLYRCTGCNVSFYCANCLNNGIWTPCCGEIAEAWSTEHWQYEKRVKAKRKPAEFLGGA